MKNSELKKYFENYPDEADLHILAAVPKDRKLYPVEHYGVLDIKGFPCLVVELGRGKDMDAELIRICEEEKQTYDKTGICR